MSDSSPPPAVTSGRRKNYLLIVLAVMLGMLAYDYRIARPSVDRAYQQITDRYLAVNDSSDRALTNLDIQQLIQKQPSRTFMDGRDLVEVYRWRSGLPIRSHELYAVYKESIKGEQVFYRQAKFAYETSEEVAPVAVPMVVDGTAEEWAVMRELSEAAQQESKDSLQQE